MHDSTASSSSTPTDTTEGGVKFAKKTLQDYEVISVIGNGSFGTCFKVRDKETGNLYAWKGIDYDELSEGQKQALISEISVLRQLQHPNIVQYYHHLVNYEAKSVFIVMECCEGGDLAQLVACARSTRRRFEEKYIWRVLFQICKALQVCHNKIRQGTILHRDIKPANIFLDGAGNAKLGDFGLARMLRRDERFADTFVGTPYYMSPEIVRGSKYDRKSDVWAVGCLVYELCALVPPFAGHAFEQLSVNIAHGKYSRIPNVYSSDLQDIISFMLETEHEQRPSIEVISRHPIVVRNITDLGNDFPKLVEAKQDFFGSAEMPKRCQLQFSPPLSDMSSSTLCTEYNSFNEDYGQRKISVSGVFTPDLCAELFYSAKRRILAEPRSSLDLIRRQSDPELYDTIRRDDEPCRPQLVARSASNASDTKEQPQQTPKKAYRSTASITQSVFDKAVLQTRLHAIRVQESLLREREVSLNAREHELNEKEKRLQQLECSLHEKVGVLKSQRVVTKTMPPPPQPPPLTDRLNQLERSRLPFPTELSPPPVPPRKFTPHEDTYCTIDPNDSMLEPPTVAKLDLATLPAAKSFATLRKVTFQSPKKFVKYDIENVVLKQPKVERQCVVPLIRASVSSKASDDSSASSGDSSHHRRKSILSALFGLTRGNKDSASKTTTAITAATTVTQAHNDKLPFPFAIKHERPVLAKTETFELSNMWTKEHKRAAFNMLAAMNAAERDGVESIRHCGVMHTTQNKFRQSVRERNTIHRNRMRRSMIGAPQSVNATVARAS